MIRLFAAVALPPEIAEPLVRRQSGLPGARWRPADTLHITLKFFGDVREDVAEDLDSELAGVGGGPFSLELSGAGHFGEGERINAVWAGVVDSPVLIQLAARCETAARRAGVKPDSRVYRPHVTLSYLRNPDPGRVAAWEQEHNLLKSPPFAVDRFGLYSSHRTSEGTRYRLEAEYPL
jgi:2'-5' RNA ligase